MDQQGTTSEWTEIDGHIFGGRILLALQAIRKLAGIGLKEAMDIHFQRYQRLRKERPGQFSCSHEEYWRDVYS